MPITSTGFTTLRSADYLAIIKAAVSAELAAQGVSGDVNYARDGIFGVMSAVVATLLGDTGGETAQALADQWNVDNAADSFADAMCALVGIYRQPATYSTVTLTIAGTGTLPAGSIARGTTGDWTTDADLALPGDVTSTCTVIGEVNAGAGSITTRVSVSGWTSVTNAADAVPGQEIETTAALMARRAESLQVSGRSSVQAIRAALLTLSYLSAAVVQENDENADAPDGQPPHSIALYVYPLGLSAAQGAEISETLYRNMSEGIQAWGDETYQVTGSDGVARGIEWSYAVEDAIAVTVSIRVDTAIYVAGSAAAAITAAFVFQVGQTVSALDFVLVLAAVPGITSVPTMTLDGAAAWADYVPAVNHIAVLDGTPTVTIV